MLKKIIFLILAMFVISPSTANASMLAGKTEEPDLPPNAVLRIRNNTGNLDQLSGTTATVFTFDGNGSTDKETSSHLLEVRFDFENDGQVDTYFSTRKIAEHTYNTPGLKTVRMEVLDRAGNVSSTTQKIYVVENTAPEAYFSVSPKIGTPATEFVFDSSLSSDSQYRRTLLEYRYDFNGDGNWDTKFEKMTLAKHKFAYPGIKNIVMEVRDPEGLSSFYRQTVYVRENRAPVAKVKATETNQPGLINFDASNSYDPDGPLQYKWDFNYTGKNDIIYDTGWYNSPIISHFYKKSGEYMVKLLVRDFDGETNESIIKVVVNLLASKM